MGEWDIEIIYLKHQGEDAGFEFYLRKDGRITHVIGKPSPVPSEPLPEDLADRTWKSLSPEEIDRVKKHVSDNARKARLAHSESMNVIGVSCGQ
jgi:hypothetical protein